MFSFFKFTARTEQAVGAHKEQDPFGQIVELPNGRYGLLDTDKTLITSYARERDAVRGAARRGIAIN
jgi:hypothetical protein